MTVADLELCAAMFAEDVKIYENGNIIATGRTAWLSFARRQLATSQRRVIGYAESSSGYSDGGGELLVIDDIDTVDRASLPPNFLADPRVAARSFLFEFGQDGLIHTVRISKAGGFWQTVH